MILSALEIDNNGTTELFIGTTLPRTEDLLAGKKQLLVEDSLSDDYQDISSIENWDKYGDSLIGLFTNFMDWKCLRNEIKELVKAITSDDIVANFASLNSEEKKIACRYLTNAVSAQDFASTFTSESERAAIGINYDSKSTASRLQRYNIMRAYLLGKIGGDNGKLFLNDCIKEGRIEAYIGGIENMAEDSVPGIDDIILGVDAYTNSDTPKGLAHRGWSTVDGSNDSLATVCTELVNKRKGLY